jgi:hypothetical protein
MLRREGPGASSIEYGPEDHHLPGVNQRLPLSGVTGHVEAKFGRGTWSLKTKVAIPEL